MSLVVERPDDRTAQVVCWPRCSALPSYWPVARPSGLCFRYRFPMQSPQRGLSLLCADLTLMESSNRCPHRSSLINSKFGSAFGSSAFSRFRVAVPMPRSVRVPSWATRTLEHICSSRQLPE